MRKTLRKSKANVWVIDLPNELTPWDSSERRTTLEELLKDYEEGWFPRRERFLKPVSKAKPLFIPSRQPNIKITFPQLNFAVKVIKDARDGIKNRNTPKGGKVTKAGLAGICHAGHSI